MNIIRTSIFLLFYLCIASWLQAQSCTIEEEEISRQITADLPGDYIAYPYNSFVTGQPPIGFPGMEEGSGRYYENGQWYERKIRMTSDTIRYGSHALHYRLPARQPEVPLSAYYPGEIYKDRLETRLINRDSISHYLGITHYSGFSLFIPSNVDTVGGTLPGRTSWNLLHQWHQSSPESPPMAITLVNGYKSRIRTNIIYGVNKSNQTSVGINRMDRPHEYDFDLPLDKWIDFVIKWRIDPFTDNGTYVIYIYDPAQPTKPPTLLYKYEGPIGYTGTLDVSHLTEAFGMYRAANPTGNWEIYYDQIRVGKDFNSILPWKETDCWRFEDDVFVMDKYEAENAATNTIIDAMLNNFSGTGYTTDIITAGKYVEFTVEAGYAAMYKVNAKYSAGPNGSNSTRTMSIYVNGTDVTQAQYPLTGSWSDWEVQTSALHLLPGTNTIRYQYDTDDLGHINLDYITLTPLGAFCDSDDPCSEVNRFDPEYNCIPVPIVDDNNNSICDLDECLSAIASNHDGNLPDNTLDTDLSTRWSGQGDGEFIEFCLNDIQILQGIELAFYKGDERTSYFDVEVSAEEGVWQNVLCYRASSGNTLDLEAFPFRPIAAKKIRIIGYGNTQNNWNSITEVKWHFGHYIEVDDTEIDETWDVVSEPGASAGTYITTNESFTNTPIDSNALVYDFTINTAGNYNIWGRCISINGNQDSFWIKLDDSDWMLWSTDISMDWNWSKINNYLNGNQSQFFLDTGAHKLFIHYRENGTKLDRLYITSANKPKPIDLNDIYVGNNALYYEAECAVPDGDWLIVNDTLASGGSYVTHLTWTTPEDSSALRFDFQIEQEASYSIYARTIAPDGASNSLFFKINDSDWTTWHISNFSSDWKWNELTNITLEAGVHTLYIENRELNTLLDNIYISNSNSCNPYGLGEQAINCTNQLCPMLGLPCNDGDICTINDVYDTNCNCNGTLLFIDTDNNNICDADQPCLLFMNLNNATEQTGIYKADDFITSTSTINSASNGTVYYQAGDEYILLDNGFSADGTVDFVAEIEDCDLN